MEILNQKNIFIPDLGVIKAETFSTIYPHVNHFICGKELQESRGGDVKEILDVKTSWDRKVYGKSYKPIK